MSLIKKALSIVALLSLSACASVQSKSDYRDASANSVKVTNMAGNSGGTGVILKSTPIVSLVLTNSHVCGVVEDGGLVSGQAGSFMVTSYKKSEVADLCLIRVAGDLQGGARLANRPPVAYYEGALVSGHPSLFPNVKTAGHFSGRQSITILMGFKACTEEDMQDPDKANVCALTGGGLPILKNFDSVLVTATISPGSSGSAVYNEDMELSGLVFAGSGQLGYAWTVPYEYVRNFVTKESKHLKYVKPSNLVNIFGNKSERSLNISDMLKKLNTVCESADKAKIKSLCDVLQNNLIK